MQKMILACAATLVLALPDAARAADHYVAPPGAPTVKAPDGSRERPFASVTEAYKSGKVQGGDRILLLAGSYGDLQLYNVSFPATVTIAPEVGGKAHFDSIFLQGNTSNLRFEGLSIWPSDPARARTTLVESVLQTSNIAVRNSTIKSDPEAEKFVSWGAEKWNARKFNGVSLRGPGSLVEDNRLVGVYMGITLTGDNSSAIGNVVDGFNGDALRGLGDNNLFQSNRVYNCVATDDNHDDGFQSWAVKDGRIRNLTLDSNIIIEWTGTPDHPLRCKLQGIGLFDGFYENLKIVNNLVSTTQYHGISVYGARGALIVNNTVVNGRNLTTNIPYIAIRDHRLGSPSTDVLLANNVAMSFTGVAASPANRIEFRNNSVVGTPGAVFVNPFAFDFQPRPDSGLVDTGDKVVAPARDLLGQPRPGGAAPDRGAYETQGASAAAASITAVLAGDGAIAPVAAAPVTPPEAEAPAAPAAPPVASLAPVGTPAPPPPPAATSIVRIPALSWVATQILNWIKIPILSRN